MHYVTPPAFNTTANYRKEYRPKLYKRLRQFVWEDAVHETVRLEPVVYDSEIEIQHLPRNLHSGRDFQLFRRIFEKEGRLSAKLHAMFVKELFVSGREEDFLSSADLFEAVLRQPDASFDMKREAICALCRIHRVSGNADRLFSLAFKLMPDAVCAELCCEIGSYFQAREDYEEAIQWFELAAHGTEAVIDVRRGGSVPLAALKVCYCKLAQQMQDGGDLDEEAVRFYLEQSERYGQEAADWTIPES